MKHKTHMVLLFFSASFGIIILSIMCKYITEVRVNICKLQRVNISTWYVNSFCSQRSLDMSPE